jgi:galactan 5-O-arabinofuranosyltransferase
VHRGAVVVPGAPPRAISRHRLSSRSVAIALAVATGAGLAIVAGHELAGSPFGPYGWGLDQSFRTAFIAKLSTHLTGDYAYRDLPWSYPPAYFFALARGANVLGRAPWEMVKFGMIAVAAVVPIVSVAMWSRVVSWPSAAAAGISALVVQEWYEPYAWIVAAAFIPWVLAVWQVERGQRGRLGGLAMVGALMASTYNGYLPVAVVMLVGTLLAGRWVRDVRPRDLRAVAIVAGGSVLLSAWYWAPLAWSALRRGTWEMLQDRYYSPGLDRVPRPFLELDTLVGWIMLAGFAYLLWRRRDRVARLMLGLVTAMYVWWTFGYIAVRVAGTSLHAHKSTLLISFALALSAGLAVVDVFVRAHGARRRAIAAVSVAVVAALLTGAPRKMMGVEERAGAVYPAKLLGEFTTAAGGADQTVLTDVLDLPVFLPTVFVFNVWSAHYAHPVAGFHERAAFIRALSHEADPAVVALMLAENRYDHVDRVVFHQGTLTQGYADDNFPNGTKSGSVTFTAEALGTLSRIDTPSLTIFHVPAADLSCRTVMRAHGRFPHDGSARLNRLAARCQD